MGTVPDRSDIEAQYRWELDSLFESDEAWEDAYEHVRRTGKTYEPDRDLSAKYAEWFSIYKQLYPAMKPISHRLFEQFLAE